MENVCIVDFKNLTSACKQLNQPVSEQEADANSCLIQIAGPGNEELARFPMTCGVSRVIVEGPEDVNDK